MPLPRNRRLLGVAVLAIMLLMGTGIAVTLLIASSGTGSNPAKEWQQIVPGETRKSEVISSLGQPAEQANIDGFDTMTYETELGLASDLFLAVKDDRVEMMVLMGDLVRHKTLDEVKADLGEPELVVPHNYVEGAKAYLFPSHGVAVVADGFSGQVFLEQSFVPVTLAEYKASWGRDLTKGSDQPPTTQ
jgi:hypothetical protein